MCWNDLHVWLRWYQSSLIYLYVPLCRECHPSSWRLYIHWTLAQFWCGLHGFQLTRGFLCWFRVLPTSPTVGHHCPIVESLPRVCWFLFTPFADCSDMFDILLYYILCLWFKLYCLYLFHFSAEHWSDKRDSIILGTSDDIWHCLIIVKKLNTCQLSFVDWHGVVSRA